MGRRREEETAVVGVRLPIGVLGEAAELAGPRRVSAWIREVVEREVGNASEAGLGRLARRARAEGAMREALAKVGVVEGTASLGSAESMSSSARSSAEPVDEVGPTAGRGRAGNKGMGRGAGGAARKRRGREESGPTAGDAAEEAPSRPLQAITAGAASSSAPSGDVSRKVCGRHGPGCGSELVLPAGCRASAVTLEEWERRRRAGEAPSDATQDMEG
jgi:hypothetical protein